MQVKHLLNSLDSMDLKVFSQKYEWSLFLVHAQYTASWVSSILKYDQTLLGWVL